MVIARILVQINLINVIGLISNNLIFQVKLLA